MGHYREDFEDQRSRNYKESPPRSQRRRDSDPHGKVIEETVRIRKVHQKPEAEPSHSHHKTRRRDSATNDDVVRVCKSPRESGRSPQDRRPPTVRRSTHAGDGGAHRHEERREPVRRDSERRSSQTAEHSRPALRSEKRSITDKLLRTAGERPPVTRYEANKTFSPREHY